ncbi:hypothetical protein [Plantactinospora endophytica]|uniref:Uncharacterized protein n=1 Tax=Plantactinospora endophytica TaxID=673535 RepID=A0ABQ4E8P3_9ACTN|nr:hypothetical protein [Plantactinospora endophytica]GIG91073.1 hypothetical protein Pen02_60090 [Plantactinospora endophytica]
MSDPSPLPAEPSDLSDLDARLAQLRGGYERWRAAANAAAVRWEWYSAEAHDLRPLWYERDLRKPGRRLAERPPLQRDHCRIGFDADGRPVAWLDHSGFPGGKLTEETYRDHSAGPEIVREARFRTGDGPIYLHEYRFEAGRIRSALAVATRGGGYEEYEYTGDRVTRIRAYHGERTGGPGSRLHPAAPYQVIDASYDGAGLSRLEITWPGPRRHVELRYERPPAGYSLDAAIEVLRRALLRQVPAVAREMGIDEPAYCVALGYFAADPVGVVVHVGLDSDRREWLAAQAEPDAPDEDTFVLWNPCDLHGLETVDYGDAAKIARLLRQELQLADAGFDTDAEAPSGVNEHVRHMLCQVAAELNTVDWSAVLPVTDDFVVYASDWQMVDFDRNLPECVPARQISLLRQRGLL